MKTSRVIALLVAIMTLVTATASAEWFYAGLDTRNVDTVEPVEFGISRIYNEIIDGDYTGKIKTVPFTLEEYKELNVGWAFESYEFAYPHAGYDRLYVDGKPMANTRYNNSFPQWETKFADYIWEIANEVDANGEYAGHRIYQRQMTKIPGYGWVWDFGKTAADEAKVYGPTTRMADVAESYKITGFANLKLNGEKLFEITEDKQLKDPAIRGQYNAINLYKDFGRYTEIENVFPSYDWENFVVTDVNSIFHIDNLSAIDVYGEYVVSDLDIAAALAPYTVATKWLDGPSYHGENGVKDVASLYIEDLKYIEATGKDISENNPMWKWEAGKIDWKWDADTVAAGIPVYEVVKDPATCVEVSKLVDYKNIEISWTDVDYEAAEDYEYYQCLVVNGIVFDGTKDTPRIIRKTQGKASPVVEWKYISWADLVKEFAELGAVMPAQAGITEVVEWKYVNGAPAYENGLPVLRIPTGEFAKCFVKITDSHLEIWRETAHGQELAMQFQMDDSNKHYYAGNVPGAVTSVYPN